MRKLARAGITLAALCLLWACSSPSDSNGSQKKGAPPAAPVKEANVFETGRAAFQRMYVSARTWSPDAQPVRLESRPHSADPGDGSAAMWAAVFVSAAKQSVRTYTWSGIAADPDKGVQPGNLDYYSPGNASTRPFDLNYLKVDSTKAFEVAEMKGGEALRKKDPKLPVKYMLFFELSKGRLLWRVIYGNSQSDSKLRILVNATTGDFVATEK